MGGKGGGKVRGVTPGVATERDAERMTRLVPGHMDHLGDLPELGLPLVLDGVLGHQRTCCMHTIQRNRETSQGLRHISKGVKVR